MPQCHVCKDMIPWGGPALCDSVWSWTTCTTVLDLVGYAFSHNRVPSEMVSNCSWQPTWISLLVTRRSDDVEMHAT
jgi:hypothetical protein